MKPILIVLDAGPRRSPHLRAIPKLRKPKTPPAQAPQAPATEDFSCKPIATFNKATQDQGSGRLDASSCR